MKTRHLRMPIAVLVTLALLCSLVPVALAGGSPAAVPGTLATLGTSAGTLAPAFDPAVFGTRANPYVLTLPEAAASVTITPAASDPADKVLVNGRALKGASFTVTLKTGQSKRETITVATAAGTKNTYYFVVKRAPSTNADLKGLSVNSAKLTPAFSPSVTAYALTVPVNRKSVVVTAKAASPYAKVFINGKRGAARVIKLGSAASTVVTVVVKPQDSGAPAKQYTITLTQGLKISSFGASPRKVKAGGAVSFSYRLSKASNATKIEIYKDGAWQEILSRADAAGAHKYVWDGKLGGAALTKGAYKVRFTASCGGIPAMSRTITILVR